MRQVQDNAETIETQQKLAVNGHLLLVVSALMVTTYLASNVMAVKLTSLFGVTLFDAGTITFPIAFVLGDVLTEIWGFTTARRVIVITFFCNVLFVAATATAIFLPAPEYMQEIAGAYEKIFTVVPRILCASLIAFLLGEIANSWIMEKLKNLTSGKHLWFRSIASSAVGYIFDTAVFVLIAFLGVADAKDLATMIFAQYLIKIAAEAIFGTPLTYLAVFLIKKRERACVGHTCGGHVALKTKSK